MNLILNLKLVYRKGLIMLHKTLLILSLLLFSACQQENQQMPSDISITYESGPTHEDRGPKIYISIIPDASNWVYTHGKQFRFISKEDGHYKTKNKILNTKVLSSAQVQNIFTQLITHNFYAMKPLYRDTQIMDGDVRSIHVRSAKGEKKVSVVNVSHKDFDAIVKSIQNIH